MVWLFGVPALGLAFAAVLRRQGLRWNWALVAAPLAAATPPLLASCLFAAWVGRRWHRADLADGGDLAGLARRRRGPSATARRRVQASKISSRDDRLAVGCDDLGRLVSIERGDRGGRHTLVVGATGSGKTVTEAWILARSIEAGQGAVVIDPKGDALLRREARGAAARAGRRYFEWSPAGSAVYNPYAHGTSAEVADKALAAEVFSEPHYLRQAQRYLGHAVRTLRGCGEVPTPRALAELMDPRVLEHRARDLPDAGEAQRVFTYLDGLDDRARATLGGARDRLAILVESELGEWLDPVDGRREELDLLDAVRSRAVVYFRLDADRLPLLGGMLAAAILQDLLTIAAELQAEPVPTLVVVDEFSAIGATSVARLFGRARSAGISMLLATQELADLRAAGGDLLEQVLGNVASLIAHRQSVPESAELVAGVGGTQGAWQTSHRLAGGTPNGDGTRSRVREYLIHPDAVRRLEPGTAAVIGVDTAIASMFHPDGGALR